MDEKKKILITYLLYIFTFIGVCIVGISNIFALETKTIYSSNSSGTLGGQNTYTYGYINQGGVQSTTTASINTTINNRALALIYYMYEPIVLNKTYTMVVNFMSNDLINTFTSNMVQVATCNSEVCNDNAIVSVVKNNPNGMSNKLTIQFTPITSGSILLVNLSDKTRTFYITGLYNNQYFGIKSVTLDSINQNEDIMNNANQNATNIINNNNSNTQEIINNQNQNTQQQIESQQVCEIYDKNNIYEDEKIINPTGEITNFSGWGVTDYIKIDKNTKIKVLLKNSSTGAGYCFYNINKVKISCYLNSSMVLNDILTIPNNASYARFSIKKSSNDPQLEICKNGSQALSDDINALNDSINDDDIDSSSATSFFSNFNDNTHGLSGIISAPLTAINSMLSNQCSPLTATWKNKTISLNCGYEFWQRLTGFKEFLNIALDGLLCYRILVKIFKLVENLKNPNDDRVEVLDL